MNISTYVQGIELLVCAAVRALELGIEGKRLGIDRSIFNLAGIRSRLLDGDAIDRWCSLVVHAGRVETGVLPLTAWANFESGWAGLDWTLWAGLADGNDSWAWE
jgi:hypothetical protein